MSLKEEWECALDTRVEDSREKSTFFKGASFEKEMKSIEGGDRVTKANGRFFFGVNFFLEEG